MMEEKSKAVEQKTQRDEIFSETVRAARRRTYFFDVKATRSNDYFLTLTESNKRFDEEKGHYFQKHKIYLFKEDFDIFLNGLNSAVDFIRNNSPESTEDEILSEEKPVAESNNDVEKEEKPEEKLEPKEPLNITEDLKEGENTDLSFDDLES